MTDFSQSSKISYENCLFDKNDLLDQKFGEYLKSIEVLKSIFKNYSKATEKFVKSTKIKNISKNSTLFSLFNEGKNFSVQESQRADEYFKRNSRHLSDIDRLKRYVETNRKMLRRRTRKNDKIYSQNKKILENSKKKQNKSGRDAHEWFIKHDSLAHVKGHDRQELEFIEFRFIHAAQEESEVSKEYKNIAKKLKNYQKDFVVENNAILGRYEEFDKLEQEKVKEQFLCLIEEQKRSLTSRLRNIETFEKNILKFDVNEAMKKYIVENRNGKFELEKPHKYEPFVPIYKRSVVEQERILRKPVKKLNLPRKGKTGGSDGQKISPGKKHTRAKSNNDVPSHPPNASLPTNPSSSVKEKKKQNGKENMKKSKKDKSTKESKGKVEVSSKPQVTDTDPIRTKEVVWFEEFFLKLTNHDEIVSNASAGDMEDDIEISKTSKEIILGNSSPNIDKPDDETPQNLEESQSQPINASTAGDVEKAPQDSDPNDEDWEFGVSKATMKKALNLLETPRGRQGIALALNYQRHHPYIVSEKVFEKLGEIITKCLQKSLEQSDKDVGKMLLNMCQTFYTIKKTTDQNSSTGSSSGQERDGKDNEEKEEEGEREDEKDENIVFYYQHLKSLSIWRDSRFWVGCFYDTMSQMRMKTLHFSQNWRDLDESRKKEAQREHMNMTFGVLTSFVFQMTQAGMSEEEVKKFILKMCEINSLDKRQVDIILMNFEEMLKNKIIPPL